MKPPPPPQPAVSLWLPVMSRSRQCRDHRIVIEIGVKAKAFDVQSVTVDIAFISRLGDEIRDVIERIFVGRVQYAGATAMPSCDYIAAAATD